jgi:predicted type IV restriction endonuclease
MQADLNELLDGYVKRVRELAEHVRGNEQATKQSLIGPLFTLLGWDLTDPRECVPEYRVDFGKDRSVKPIDWAFKQDGRPIFFVEAKEVGKKLVHYDEQLADYFAKAPEAKLGVLTNGVQWRFFTDVVNLNVMDREPFARWDVIADEELPFDLLTLLQKSQYNSQLIRTYAERQRAQNLMVTEIGRLLEPSLEFIRLAVQNIETRRLTDNVLESWKPTLSNAINEWAKQRMLATVLEMQKLASAQAEEPVGSKIVTTPEELEGFAIIQRLLGEDRPARYEDTVSYFKIHLPERYTWVFCRLYFDRKRPTFWVALPLEAVQTLAPEIVASTPQLGWTCITMNSVTDLESFGDVLRAAWDAQRALRIKGGEQLAPEPEPAIPSE